MFLLCIFLLFSFFCFTNCNGYVLHHVCILYFFYAFGIPPMLSLYDWWWLIPTSLSLGLTLPIEVLLSLSSCLRCCVCVQMKKNARWMSKSPAMIMMDTCIASTNLAGYTLAILFAWWWCMAEMRIKKKERERITWSAYICHSTSNQCMTWHRYLPLNETEPSLSYGESKRRRSSSGGEKRGGVTPTTYTLHTRPESIPTTAPRVCLHPHAFPSWILTCSYRIHRR